MPYSWNCLGVGKMIVPQHCLLAGLVERDLVKLADGHAHEWIEAMDGEVGVEEVFPAVLEIDLGRIAGQEGELDPSDIGWGFLR